MKFLKPSLLSLLSLAFVFILLLQSACDPDEPSKPRDPNIIDTPENLDEDRSFISRPTLQSPIYACAQTVVVKDFIIGATLEIFVEGVSVTTHTGIWYGGEPVKLPNPLVEGQSVYATQTYDGAVSLPSNTVVVTNYLEDYPGGLPKPRISRSPLLECGRAIGIEDAVPGAVVRAYAENPRAGGGFDPAVEIGSVSDFGYMFVTSLQEGARVWLRQFLCTDESDPSSSKIVDPEPGTIPAPSFDPQPVDGADIVVIWGPGGAPNELLNGANLEIKEGGALVGGQPTPGGGQQVYVNPRVDDAKTYEVTQELCTKSPPTSVTPLPCSALQAPTIYPPQPNDTQIEVINCYPGAQILVFAGGQEIGHSGPYTINLSRPINSGETIIVVQKLGDCISATAFSIPAECNQAQYTNACGDDWPAFRQSGARDANQRHSQELGDAAFVKKLAVQWRFQPSGDESLPRGFTGSPIVYRGKVYVGASNGRLYALDANNGNLLWKYPPTGSAPKVSDFTCNSSSFGIASSPMIGIIRGEQEVVIFAAPDNTYGTGLGSSRLFALNLNTGGVVWESPEVAILNGTDDYNYSELHEQTGYSSPLVYNNRVYIGIANHCDNPIQKGKVKAVDLTSGSLVGGFLFEAVPGGGTGQNGRGGGVWNSPSGGYTDGIFFTTGNTNIGQPQPKPNHGLSLIKVDQNNGNLIWKLQPVPFELDGDPDWATGAVILQTACGEMALSTMKDGWAYGVKASSSGAFVPALWQFPPTGSYDPATGHYFHSGDGTNHGDIRYLVAGAGWKGTYISMMGGEEVTENINLGFGRLHSLGACSGNVRWISDIPGTGDFDYQLGPPSVTKGIVFVGTAQGRLIALADPSVYPSAKSRCSHSGFSVEDCESNGYSIVKDPIVLLDIQLNGGSLIRNEPVIANDRVFISTGGGQVIMLEPE